VCENRSLLCEYRSLVCENRSLLCEYRSLVCENRSLLCEYASLWCVYVPEQVEDGEGPRSRWSMCVQNLSHTHTHTHNPNNISASLYSFCVSRQVFCVKVGLFCVSRQVFCVKVGLFCVKALLFHKESYFLTHTKDLCSHTRGLCSHKRDLFSQKSFGVATISRLHKMIGLFCRISSLL